MRIALLIYYSCNIYFPLRDYISERAIYCPENYNSDNFTTMLVLRFRMKCVVIINIVYELLHGFVATFFKCHILMMKFHSVGIKCFPS